MDEVVLPPFLSRERDEAGTKVPACREDGREWNGETWRLLHYTRPPLAACADIKETLSRGHGE